MAVRIEKNEETFNGNGWTRYQQLVLNELERHEAKLDALEKEITNLKLSNARLEMELRQISETLKNLTAKIEGIDGNFQTKTGALNTEREKMASDLNILKWKLGAFATAAATVISVVLQTVVKFFLHLG